MTLFSARRALRSKLTSVNRIPCNSINYYFIDSELIVIVMKTQFTFYIVVKRLNAVVEEYQRKYLPVKEPDIKVQVTKHLYPIIQ